MLYDNPNFYPTPQGVAEIMMNMVDWNRVRFILEPSAGKGDLIKAVKQKNKRKEYSPITESDRVEIDCIEKDENLRNLLKGAEEIIIDDDFLTFSTFKKYDLIIQNPPFDEGDKHLLKAIELMKSGGQIVSLLNAETLKNPYTNTRKELVKKLDELNAKIEYGLHLFSNAERATDVEIAFIYIDIPFNTGLSIILDDMEKPEGLVMQEYSEDRKLTYYEVIKRMVQEYNYVANVGIKLIEEYCHIAPYMPCVIGKDSDPIITLEIVKKKPYRLIDKVNLFLKKLRGSYWYMLGNNEEFHERMTSNLRTVYYNRINELQNYDFTLKNIDIIDKQLRAQMAQAVDETIINLFDKLSQKHAWYPECNNNIHYYNGWATNKAHKINKKVIIPQSVVNWDNDFRLGYEVETLLSDMERTLDYLNDGRVGNYLPIERVIRRAQAYGEFKKVESKYFVMSFYKKGTIHLTFKNDELLKRLNIFGSNKKAWLPPNYGRKTYSELEPEERLVIDEFEGEEEYNKVIQDKEYYLKGADDILRIA